MSLTIYGTKNYKLCIEKFEKIITENNGLKNTINPFNLDIDNLDKNKIFFLNPENDLHPELQIKLALKIVDLVNCGKDVFLFTNSDYIVREINNCIMLDNLSIDDIKKTKYKQKNKLNYKKVKAFIFKDNGKSKEIKITKHQGIFFEIFDKVIDRQNCNQGRIFELVMNIKNKEKVIDCEI